MGLVQRYGSPPSNVRRKVDWSRWQNLRSVKPAHAKIAFTPSQISMRLDAGETITLEDVISLLEHIKLQQVMLLRIHDQLVDARAELNARKQ